MGTMFDIVVYHPSRPRRGAGGRGSDGGDRAARSRAEPLQGRQRSVTPQSRGPRGFVAVDPSLYEIVARSIEFSRRTGGTFDITIAPLLRTWKQAARRRPSSVGWRDRAARRCVGSDQIDLDAPDRIHFRSACLAIDLGGIGKGYAVDRAMAMFEAAGIRHAMINAGGSSIGAIGTPPGRTAGPCASATVIGQRQVLLLRDMSMSTSQQNPLPSRDDRGQLRRNPRSAPGAPAEARRRSPSSRRAAPTAEALTKTLLMMPFGEAKALLDAVSGRVGLVDVARWRAARGAWRVPALIAAVRRESLIYHALLLVRSLVVLVLLRGFVLTRGPGGSAGPVGSRSTFRRPTASASPRSSFPRRTPPRCARARAGLSRGPRSRRGGAGGIRASGRARGRDREGPATRAQLSQLRLRLKPRGITRADARGARQVAAHPIQLGDERKRRAAGRRAARSSRGSRTTPR